MFALPISKQSFKKALFLNQNSPKMKLFLQTNAEFSNAWDGPKTDPPHWEFLATRLNEIKTKNLCTENNCQFQLL